MDKFSAMISPEDALATIERTLADCKLLAQTIRAVNAVGLTLLDDRKSLLDLPPFDKSAMDGYALLADDNRDKYRLLETVNAGKAPTVKLKPGTAVKVMTGAPVPKGAGRVVMVEQTTERGGEVFVASHDGGTNICPAGQDIRAGDTILPAGKKLMPLDVANLISCGITEVRVARPVRVAIISTGDEIVDSPDDLAGGKIMNSNGPMLCALAEQSAMDVVMQQSVGDDPQLVVQTLRSATEAADLVVISGGVSVGDRDFVLDAMEKIGLTLHFTRLAVQPGKPTTYATGNASAVLGLPGNPVSAFLMFHLFVVPVADLMSGGGSGKTGPREFTLKLENGFSRKKTERRLYVPAVLSDSGAVRAVEYHGSAHLAALSEADGFFVVPVSVSELRAGSEVQFLPIGGLFQ